MINTEARFREVYINPEGEEITRSYVIPEKVYYYIEKLEQELNDTTDRANKLEDSIRRDELETAQRVIANLCSDKGGLGYCCLSDRDNGNTLGSDFWKECATRIIRALNHRDERGVYVEKDRIGRLDPKEAEKLKKNAKG